jgi:hypothetical protein
VRYFDGLAVVRSCELWDIEVSVLLLRNVVSSRQVSILATYEFLKFGLLNREK